MNTEIWKPIVGYDGLYEVSNRGRVKAVHSRNGITSGKILKAFPSPNGYLQVTLYDASGHRKPLRCSVHCLVLEAFVGPRPERYQCRHLDGVRNNNILENLAWGTVSENHEDSKRHGTFVNGERNGHSKLTQKEVLEIRFLRDNGIACETIGGMYGVDWSNVWLIGNRKSWKHVPESIHHAWINTCTP